MCCRISRPGHFCFQSPGLVVVVGGGRGGGAQSRYNIKDHRSLPKAMQLLSLGPSRAQTWFLEGHEVMGLSAQEKQLQKFSDAEGREGGEECYSWEQSNLGGSRCAHSQGQAAWASCTSISRATELGSRFPCPSEALPPRRAGKHYLSSHLSHSERKDGITPPPQSASGGWR